MRRGYTALMFAANGGKLEALKVLLAKGAQVDAKACSLLNMDTMM